MIVDLIMPDDATLIEVAELAAAANVVLIERGGHTAWCARTHIPDGWHRCGMVTKTPQNTSAKEQKCHT